MTPTRMTDVDGVPVLLAPGAGPMRAGLMFRVGIVDETLATAGITHLVEHLALHRHGPADYHYNGMTGPTTTQFVIQGTPEAVTSFLHSVCASLADLPIDRLTAEKKIIETEASGRPTPLNHQMPLWRHGAQDFGLPSYPEWGVHTVTGEQVADWAVSRFNRGNAVLWIAGDDVPRGLRLDLPDGERWQLPKESSALPVTPAYFFGGAPTIVLDAQVPRTGPATTYARALDRALFRELRRERGLSYTAATAYGTDGRSQATITAAADAQPDELGTVLDCFLAQLRSLQDTDIDASELEAIRALELEGLTNPEIEAGLLPRRATDLLTGFPSRTTAELVDGFRETTAADIREIARIVNSSALLMVPHVIARPPVGFEAAPTLSRFGVVGKRHRSRTDHRVAIVHGADGVTLSTPQGPATVLFDECVALLRYPDGARHLYGADGINVRIEPTLFAMTTAALSGIDNMVPPAAIVDMPVRDAASIPKPARTAGLRGRLRALLRTLSVLRRTRLDRFAVLQGGVVSRLISTGLIVTAVAMVGIALASDRPRFGAVALMCGVVLMWRRHNLGRW